jgi:hypothetical protein
MFIQQVKISLNRQPNEKQECQLVSWNHSEIHSLRTSLFEWLEQSPKPNLIILFATATNDSCQLNIVKEIQNSRQPKKNNLLSHRVLGSLSLFISTHQRTTLSFQPFLIQLSLSFIHSYTEIELGVGRLQPNLLSHRFCGNFPLFVSTN